MTPRQRIDQAYQLGHLTRTERNQLNDCVRRDDIDGIATILLGIIARASEIVVSLQTALRAAHTDERK